MGETGCEEVAIKVTDWSVGLYERRVRQWFKKQDPEVDPEEHKLSLYCG